MSNIRTYTTLEISKKIGSNKQRVYRYIKRNNIKEAHQEAGVMYYSEKVLNLIKQDFNDNKENNNSHQEALHNHINDMKNEALVKQLEIKDIQLENKDKQLAQANERLADMQRLLDQQQRLTLSSVQEAQTLKIELNEVKNTPKKWWQRKGESNE